MKRKRAPQNVRPKPMKARIGESWSIEKMRAEAPGAVKAMQILYAVRVPKVVFAFLRSCLRFSTSAWSCSIVDDKACCVRAASMRCCVATVSTVSASVSLCFFCGHMWFTSRVMLVGCC